MSKKILDFNTYSQALDAVIAEISLYKADLSTRHIILTPEKYTLLCEQRLCRNAPGTFNAEAYSLSRLYAKLGGGFCLPQEAALWY